MQETIYEQVVRAHKGLADFAFVITHLSIEDVIKRMGNTTYEEALSTHGDIRILVDSQLLHEFTGLAKRLRFMRSESVGSWGMNQGRHKLRYGCPGLCRPCEACAVI